MISPIILLLGWLGIAILLLVMLILRPDWTRAPGGKVFALVAIFVAPALAVFAGGVDHLERSKQTSFCLSCHVMQQYGRSLHVDDSEFIPAVHYQNNYVPREEACYTCHTDYVMYGTLKSKLRGIRHLAVQYLGSVPDTVRLYKPYRNRECLHCHAGARKFLSVGAHRGEEGFFADVASEKRSCLESGCHDVAHNVRELEDVSFWKEGMP